MQETASVVGIDLSGKRLVVGVDVVVAFGRRCCGGWRSLVFSSFFGDVGGFGEFLCFGRAEIGALLIQVSLDHWC